MENPSFYRLGDLNVAGLWLGEKVKDTYFAELHHRMPLQISRMHYLIREDNVCVVCKKDDAECTCDCKSYKLTLSLVNLSYTTPTHDIVKMFNKVYSATKNHFKTFDAVFPTNSRPADTPYRNEPRTLVVTIQFTPKQTTIQACYQWRERKLDLFRARMDREICKIPLLMSISTLGALCSVYTAYRDSPDLHAVRLDYTISKTLKTNTPLHKEGLLSPSKKFALIEILNTTTKHGGQFAVLKRGEDIILRVSVYKDTAAEFKPSLHVETEH